MARGGWSNRGLTNKFDDSEALKNGRNRDARATCRLTQTGCVWFAHSELATLIMEVSYSNDETVRLDSAVNRLREILEQCPASHPKHSDVQNDLAASLLQRYQALGETDNLQEAITRFYHALALCPPDDPDRSTSLSNLAIALCSRFRRLGNLEDLEESIKVHRQALNFCPPGHPTRSRCLDNFAAAVHIRFTQLGKLDDLEEAITHHQLALDLRPLGHPERSRSLDNLASALLTRFEQSGEREDLQQAIIHCQESLDLRPIDHPDRSKSLYHLAHNLLTRFQQCGEMDDLEQAIMYNRQALDVCPLGHPDRSALLHNLANGVNTRFAQLGKMNDLEEAIMHYKEALNLRPPGHPDRFASLNNLASAMLTCFQQLGNVKDLEQAITLHREAFGLHLPGHPRISATLTNLANALYMRFQHLGKMEDLEDTIAHRRQVLNLCPPGHPLHSTSLNNLANSMYTRFQQLGKMEDLEEAITHHRQALDLHPPGHPHHCKSLNNLAYALYTRFEWSDKMGDLEEAIMYHRQALSLRLPGQPGYVASLNNLAGALSTCFEKLGKMEDLDEAIMHHQQALDLCPPGHPDCPTSLLNLALTVSTRFDKLHSMKDLEESIRLLSDVEKSLHPHHPEHSSTGSMLAFRIVRLCHDFPGPEHTSQMISDAFALFESAAQHSTSSAHDQLVATLRWINAAELVQHTSLLSAYITALARLDHRITVTPSVQSWQKFLATVPVSLAPDAASCAIKASKLEIAVELLEQGRSILWSKMQGFRHPIDKLRDIHGDLADEFDCISQELDQYTMSFDLKSQSPEILDAQIQDHRILLKKWDEVVQRIRAMDGFQTFLQTIPFASLQAAATEGPVIVVNISQFRSDAIILHESNPPALVHLPKASPDTIQKLSNDISSALAKDHNAWTKMGPILRDLWNFVVSPVVDKLAAMGVAERSRIWWCPTGQLCALPLHAAGPYRPRQKNLPALYISSYTPTLSSLIQARSKMVPRLTARRVLAMGQPNDNMESMDLPYVREELRRIHCLGDSVDVLLGEGANRETLLPRIQQYPWIHFACHAYEVQNEPFLSFFRLHNNECLTLVDLIKARLSNAEFAFLSACRSAATTVGNTPDEVIHPAAALQFCGFRSVVGTLWPVRDRDGPDVAEEFYRYMFRETGGPGDFRDSAKALNFATSVMRSRGVGLDRWINYVHIGA